MSQKLITSSGYWRTRSIVRSFIHVFYHRNILLIKTVAHLLIAISHMTFVKAAFCSSKLNAFWMDVINVQKRFKEAFVSRQKFIKCWSDADWRFHAVKEAVYFNRITSFAKEWIVSSEHCSCACSFFQQRLRKERNASSLKAHYWFAKNINSNLICWTKCSKRTNLRKIGAKRIRRQTFDAFSSLAKWILGTFESICTVSL